MVNQCPHFDDAKERQSQREKRKKKNAWKLQKLDALYVHILTHILYTRVHTHNISSSQSVSRSVVTTLDTKCATQESAFEVPLPSNQVAKSREKSK